MVIRELWVVSWRLVHIERRQGGFLPWCSLKACEMCDGAATDLSVA